jgi:hypothetical protein
MVILTTFFDLNLENKSSQFLGAHKKAKKFE